MRIHIKLALLPLLIFATVPLLLGQASSSHPVTDNAEMQAIFMADQVDRGNNPYARPGDPQPPGLPGLKIRKNDDARELKVKALLAAGSLHTGTDYFRAALIFQHAATADGQLFAHLLASVSVQKGYVGALWLEAASLDRFLSTIGRKQVFGTQFRPSAAQPDTYTQDQVDSALVSDALRAEFCVQPLSTQQKSLPGPPTSTTLVPCPAGHALRDHFTPSR